ncbi:MAG: class I SAM-dependent methyltransferase [Terracidiphilus sp.]
MHFQAQKPLGPQGRRTLQVMNRHHASLTDWGLAQLSIPGGGRILDIGCGGGRTLSRLAALAPGARIYGLDYSPESIRLARHRNARSVHSGRMVIRQGSVSRLPYASNRFSLVTGVETHFFWPNLPADLREVLRVLAPGGEFALIADTWAGSRSGNSRTVRKHRASSRMTLLTPEEHVALLREAGFVEVQLHRDADQEWLCAVGRKPGR